MNVVKDDCVVHDKRFIHLITGNAQKELLYSGNRWAEGPVWFDDLQCLLWSDIPNNRIMRWTPDGSVSVFRSNSNNSNGHTRDREGRLVSCEHGGRRVTRTEVDGTITVIADAYEDRRLNSPNDVVVKSDGSIWFTDPDYGIMSDYEGNKGEREQDTCNVYRVDPATGTIEAVITDMAKPNGLAFSPDEAILYVADSAFSHDPDAPRVIRAYKVGDDGSLSGGEVFCEVSVGLPDGLRIDTDGNVWTSAGPGIEVWSPGGDLLGRINFPNDVANLTFGGPKRNRLFITCTYEVYALYVTATGVQRP